MGKSQKKTWEEFIDSGMLWWVNRIIHTFGWSIVVAEGNDGLIANAYPRRTTWLGFSDEVNEAKFEDFKNHINPSDLFSG